MDYSGIERRQDPRYDVKFPVRFRIAEAGGSKVFEASGKDISAGGLCMEIALSSKESVEKVYSSKGKLDMEIQVEGMGVPIKTEGSIVWIRKDKDNDILGIFFKNISEQHRGALASYVNSKLKLPG